MFSPAARADPLRMQWQVTTRGDLPDDSEQRQYDASAPAWHDYAGRILGLEIHGYVRDSEDGQYGKRWVCELRRGIERISVTIERMPTASVSGFREAGLAGLEPATYGFWRPTARF